LQSSQKQPSVLLFDFSCTSIWKETGVRRLQTGFPILMEQLEGRALMSVMSMGPESLVINVPLGQIAGAESGPKSQWDAGDFYYYYEQKIKLLRRTDYLLIGVEKGNNVTRFGQQLTGPNGLLRDFQVLPFQDKHVLYLQAKTPLSVPAFKELRHAVEKVAGVAWATPTFETLDGSPIGVTNNVIVKLDPGADPQAVLGHHDFRRAGPDNIWQFHTRKGGVATLRFANQLQHLPGVQWATPDLYSKAIPL
jgi:hypothetical protein